MIIVAETLSLQDLDDDVITAGGVYRSDNSVYACVVVSSFSILC